MQVGGDLPPLFGETAGDRPAASIGYSLREIVSRFSNWICDAPSGTPLLSAIVRTAVDPRRVTGKICFQDAWVTPTAGANHYPLAHTGAHDLGHFRPSPKAQRGRTPTRVLAVA